MHSAAPSKALVGGFIATLVMTFAIYVAPILGLPKIDIAAMLGSVISGSMPAPSSGIWWAGMAAHLILGSVVFSLIYAYGVYAWLPGANWLRGAMWATILWLLWQAAAMPAMGQGFFSDRDPDRGVLLLATLIVHWIYGAILGAIAGVQATRLPVHGHERHA